MKDEGRKVEAQGRKLKGGGGGRMTEGERPITTARYESEIVE
jgi:hypothetical protein